MKNQQRTLKVMHLISGDLWAGAEVQAYTLLSRLRQMPNVEIIAVLLNHGQLQNRLVDSGVSTVVIDEQAHGFVSIVRQLRKLLVSVRPDILHTHRYKENVLGGLATGCGSLCKLVRTVHGTADAFSGYRHLKMT